MHAMYEDYLLQKFTKLIKASASYTFVKSLSESSSSLGTLKSILWIRLAADPNGETPVRFPEPLLKNKVS